MIEAIIYLLAISATAAVGVFWAPPWGMLSHTVILTVIIVRSALVNQYLHQQLLLPLALVPLLKITSLAMLVTSMPPILSYYLSYVPLFAAAAVVMAILGYTRKQVGLSLKRFPVQLVVGLTGIIFGVAGYFVLAPEPVIADLSLPEVVFPALVLFACTGFIEEFVFRGVLQSSSTKVFGGWGVVYVSLLFTVANLGFVPGIGLVFVFVVALFFGWVVRKTGSLLGVTLSHGVTNIVLFIIAPFFF